MKRARFAAAVLLVLIAAGFIVYAVHSGYWLTAAWCGLAFVVCIMAAFFAGVSMVPKGRKGSWR
jgi:hypothetical protein